MKQIKISDATMKQISESFCLSFKEKIEFSKLLDKLGVDVILGENEITVIAPDELKKPSEPLCGHNDHRIVMACAVLLTLVGGELEGTEAVSKSFPDFFEILFSLNKAN